MALGFLTVIVLGLSVQPTPQQLVQTRLQIHGIDGRVLNYTVEVAKTPQEITTGLMFRREMPANYGMLFVFNDDQERGFWMQNTLIPLDMIFILADGTIHNIHQMARPHDMTVVSSMGPVRAVLEINGGEAVKNGIQMGDVVKHEALGNMEGQ